MDAVIGDLFDMASGQATEARRWNAMREIRKQISKEAPAKVGE
jgi:hypothetical protein